MRGNRGWLALVYVLATVLAQGVHDHGPAADVSESRHDAGCKDPRPHFSGHASPDLGHATDHCVACQYRAQHYSWQITTPSYLPTTASALDEAPLAPVRPGSSRRITCRGPPRA